jgi:hypothetical protein
MHPLNDAIFALAIAGYLLLGVCVVVEGANGLRPRVGRWLAALLAGIVLAHVLGVWGVRFGGSIEEALRKGWAGFLVFHTALALILAAPFVPPRWTARLHDAAFPIVSAGAVGAVLNYDFVAEYKLSVFGILLTTTSIVLWRVFQVIRRISQSPSRGES